MTGAIVACFARGRSVLRGIGSWRVKETDRIVAMATELRKLGATVEEGNDWLAVEGPVDTGAKRIFDTYDDHRVAMCFSLAAVSGRRVTIRDPDCVAKTFPDYFDRLATLQTERATRRIGAEAVAAAALRALEALQGKPNEAFAGELAPRSPFSAMPMETVTLRYFVPTGTRRLAARVRMR